MDCPGTSWRAVCPTSRPGPDFRLGLSAPGPMLSSTDRQENMGLRIRIDGSFAHYAHLSL